MIGLAYVMMPFPTAPVETSTIRTIEIGGVPLRVEIADTDTLRAKGLGGHEPLQPDEGMLFIFETEGIYSFWMKDMRFPIDILWLALDGKVVHIEKNVSPESYPTSFTPGSPAQYVLEVRAGFVDQYDIRIGSRATLGE